MPSADPYSREYRFGRKHCLGTVVAVTVPGRAQKGQPAGSQQGEPASSSYPGTAQTRCRSRSAADRLLFLQRTGTFRGTASLACALLPGSAPSRELCFVPFPGGRGACQPGYDGVPKAIFYSNYQPRQRILPPRNTGLDWLQLCNSVASQELPPEDRSSFFGSARTNTKIVIGGWRWGRFHSKTFFLRSPEIGRNVQGGHPGRCRLAGAIRPLPLSLPLAR